MKRTGRVRGGVIVLDAAESLPEGTVVDVQVVATPQASDRIERVWDVEGINYDFAAFDQLRDASGC